MPLYKLVITETLWKPIFVEAPTEEEAEELANQLYDDGEIVLSADDYVGTERYMSNVTEEDKVYLKEHSEVLHKV